jgi:hypothetical protein
VCTQSARSALTESVSTRKLRRNNVRFLCRKCKVTAARCAQSSQELKSCVKIFCKECTGLEFDEESKRLHKEVEGQEQRNARKAGKNYFQESLDLSLTNFPEKQEVLGRSKSLRRSSSGGTTLSKKCERDPRNRLAGRIKVETFTSFENILS